jgi:alkylated DNA repair protein (DNA oxidative demethylase)
LFDIARLGRLALAAAAGDPRAGDGYTPDATLANYYDRDALLGMHQDKDERDDAPVVSLSVGDSCTFRFGNTRDRGRPYQGVLLASGDLFVFGGAARFAFHGVTKIHPGTSPAGCGLAEGRINIVMRLTGLE